MSKRANPGVEVTAPKVECDDAGQNAGPRKKIMRFSVRHDILLLREVLAQNPIAVHLKESGKAWGRVAERLMETDESFKIDSRRCRERTYRLLDYYKQKDFTSLRRTGTEEEFREKEKLLQDIKKLEDNKTALRIKLVVNKDYEREKISQMKKTAAAAMETPITSGNDDKISHNNYSNTAEEPSKVCCTCNAQTDGVLLYLKQKQAEDTVLRKEELALRREELKLERERIELDRQRLQMEQKEREERFRLESQERSALIDILKQKLM
ncbi:uncharacterized protein LOC144444440 [Glandiceps talaboti]